MKSLFNSLRAAWSYAWPRLRSVFGTAAKLAARRAELARLDAVTFSQLYLASGKAVAVAKTLPADLEALRKKVASLQDSLSSRGERSEHSSAPTRGIGGMFNRVVREATKATSDATLNVQVTVAYRHLGKAAVEKYGEKAIPQQLRKAFEEASSRRQGLLDTIQQLESQPGYGVFTARRVAVAGVCVVTVALVWGGRASLVAMLGRSSSVAGTESSYRSGSAPLPQRPRNSVAWQADSEKGANAVKSAVVFALGDVSSVFGRDSFGGVTLGANYMKELGPGVDFDAPPEAPFCLTAPSRSRDEARDSEAETRVVVDARSNRIIGIVRDYRFAHPRDVEDKVLSTFGDPLKKPSREWQLMGPALRLVTITSYTFPRVIVRVVRHERGDLRNGSQRSGVTIWMFDRATVEHDVRAFANSVAATCAWMKRSREMSVEGTFSAARWPSLADTKPVAEEMEAFAVFLDDYQTELRARAVKAGAEKEPMWSPPDDLVAVAGASHDFVAFAAQPDRSSSVPMTDFLAVGPPTGPCRLDQTPFDDLLQQAASFVCQAYFPPRGEKISVVIQQEPVTARWFDESSIPSKVRGLFNATKGNRHEWADRDGWVVRVSDSGRVSISKGSL